MAYDSLLTAEMKTILASVSLGLTLRHLAQRHLNDGLAELVALFGVGVVLLVLIDELRRRSQTE